MHSFHQCLKCCCDRFTFDEEDFISIDKIKIQNDNNSEYFQKKPKYTVEVIYECSIGRSGMNGLSKYTLNDKVFYISTNNLNYFDYLNPNCIQNISEVDENTIKIQLDRHVIRHCDERYILIDYVTGKIKWYNVSNSTHPHYGGTTEYVIEDNGLSLHVIE